MAPPHFSVENLVTRLQSLPKKEMAPFLRSLPQKTKQLLASHYVQKAGLDEQSKEISALHTLPPEQQLAALAALPNEKRDLVLARFVECMESAGTYGDYTTETMALQWQEQFDNLLCRESEFDRGFKKSAKALVHAGGFAIDVEASRKLCEVMVTELFGNWNLLRMILQSYEGLLQTRWAKETRSQRQAILLRVWPEIPKGHRPDMTGFFRKDNSVYMYACPYINLEDLSGPKALLIFLNSRGRHHPVNFAYSDLELAPLFKTPKEYLEVRKTNFTMSFIGCTSPTHYGAWVEWPNEASAIESIRTGRTKHVDHGIQILHIQTLVMAFLMSCVTQLLHDKVLTELPTSLPESPRLSNQDKAYDKMDIIAREAPFRLPSQLDLARLHALITAQKAQAIDHAWALREDPGYFASAAEEYREHRSELLLDEAGNLHPHSADFPLYNKAVRHMAADAHCLVFVWDEIEKRISRLRQIWSKCAAAISIDVDLPSELHEALVETRYFIQKVLLDLLSDIGTKFHSSPALRTYHYRANADDPNLRKYKVMSVDIDPDDTSLEHLLNLKSALCNHDSRCYFTTHAILDELERLMQSDTRAKSLISAHLAKDLSRLSLLAECLHQLHQFQPWAHKIEEDMEERKWELLVKYDKIFLHWGRICAGYQAFEKKRLYNLCTPRDGKFAYPAHERPTRNNNDRMRSAEAALDAFWKGADAHWMRLVHTTPSALVRHIMGDRTLMRTQPWVSPPKNIKLSQSLAPANAAPVAFSEHSHDATKQITGAFAKTTLSVKSKSKTRGIATVEDNNKPILAPAPVASSPSRAVFKVDKRSLKVFRTLFHSPNSPNQPGEVAWSDLLHAMISVGFGAEKLRSSAWHFTPPHSIGERSIQLHEPHPSSKLAFVLARHYGRRLNIAFQWTSETFELA